jgi:hypothetical protein
MIGAQSLDLGAQRGDLQRGGMCVASAAGRRNRELGGEAERFGAVALVHFFSRFPSAHRHSRERGKRQFANGNPAGKTYPQILDPRFRGDDDGRMRG